MDSIWIPTEDQECDNVPDVKEDYKDEGSLPTKPAKVLGAERIKDSSYGPSCPLIKSEHSMGPSASFKEEIFVHERQSDQSEKLYPSATLRRFEERFMSLMKREMKKISQILGSGYGASVENLEEDQDSNDVREAALKIALHILRDMKEKDLVEKLIKFEDVHKLQKTLQSSLKHKSQHVFEGIAKQGNPTLLNKIYTELYITEGGCGTPNDEHENLEVFDLRKYIKSDDGYKRLKPVAKASQIVILSSCNLTKNICHSLASILMLKTCAIRELDLSYNLLQDKGVAQLSRGLLNSNCRLKVLKLAFCGLTRTGCSRIVSALHSNPGHLRELDLSYNLIGSEALTELVALLPKSRIETLRIVHCNVKKEWCAFLASAASTTAFHLKHLDLSENTIGNLGARVFPELLSNTNCKLQSLRLSCCEFTERGFFDIASALKSNPTCLRYLDLSKNFPGKTAMEKLCAAIRQPSCTLQTLCLDQCDLDSEICPSLVKTLQNSSLRELSLSHNNLGDVGVRTIFTGLQNRRCPLKILRLANCSLTDNIFHFLAPALSPNTVGLSELDLSSNNLSQDRASFLCSISYINIIL
ncbi:NACHT, LRR and PYD domains-containing protein 3-like isoform X6 [Tachysurus ichikawai]